MRKYLLADIGRSIRSLGAKPFFWILIPVFFILKNAYIYRTALYFRPCILLLLEYLAGAAILYFLLFLLFAKNNYRAAFLCATLLAFYFFYYSFDLFLQTQTWLFPFSRYRWSLSAAALLIIIAFFYIRRMQRPSRRTIGFLNMLLVLFCLSEAIPLLYRSMAPQPPPLLTIRKETAPPRFTPVTSGRPNIYFLLFDEYQGNDGLQKAYNYSNAYLRNTLADKGFFSPQTARSNYNFTFFSMPSIFNMSYLDGEIQAKTSSINLLRFLSGIDLIRHSRLAGFLKDIDYRMIDLSPFPLDDSGKAITQFRTVVTRNSLFTDQTLSHFAIEKFSWIIPGKKLLRLLDPLDYNLQFYNEYVRQQLVNASAASAGKPKFVYAHLFIPHSPYLKDAEGNDVKFQELNYPQHYLGYLQYGNSILLNSIETIIKNDPASIIMIMSDHGNRSLGGERAALQFDIQFYVRTPDQSYSGWPDTVDAVNAFRILLNRQFDQKLEYLDYHSYEFSLPNPLGSPAR